MPPRREVSRSKRGCSTRVQRHRGWRCHGFCKPAIPRCLISEFRRQQRGWRKVPCRGSRGSPTCAA
ncbi:hypothetical protein T484DRAFT_1930754 [Baffinella frigidus]|nr:hypothetical protein T484DRAFT_1930754 [Cryptophyta sp. CCMP2293]